MVYCCTTQFARILSRTKGNTEYDSDVCSVIQIEFA